MEHAVEQIVVLSYCAPIGAHALKLGDIGAGGERLGPGTAKGDTAHLVVAVELCHRRGNAAPHGVVDRVLLRRLVEYQPADRAALLDQKAQGLPAGPWIEGTVARLSRGAQRPASTWRRKSSKNWLKSAGSSRLIAWPLLGKMARPAVGMQRVMSRFASRQGSSSSPIMMSVGTALCFIGSARTEIHGRPVDRA